jgi:1,2-dihydroxy-3-keto-5-methylthiopentene dioxygenase
MKAHWLDAAGSAAASEAISADELLQNDVYYARHETDEASYRAPIDALKQERGYIEEDQVALSPETPSLDAICAKFIDEHTHDDDEVRFVLEGEGIFDIRSKDDRFMRVLVEKGDLIVVPKDRNHRFMLTEQKAIRCVRLFKDQSGWVPHYRAK